MNILAYIDVDPFEVLNLNLLGRDVVFTPETAAALRRSDQRIFPWLTLNAVERGSVTGQVGAFRLAMVSIEGRMDVGCAWGFVMRPDVKSREPGEGLLEELHARMRAERLSFSVVFANPRMPEFRAFGRLGYRRLHSPGSAFARWHTAYQPTRLSAGPAGPDGCERVERLFSAIAEPYLGFSRRPSPFPPLRAVNPGHVWIIRQAGEAVGFALAHTDQSVLKVSQVVLQPGTNAAEAVAALAGNLRAGYVQVEVNRPAEISDLRRAGFQLNRPSNGSLMICPLDPGLTVADARRLFAAGTERFLFSRLDVQGP